MCKVTNLYIHCGTSKKTDSIITYINNNIWHLRSLSVDGSQRYVLEIRVSLRYTL